MSVMKGIQYDTSFGQNPGQITGCCTPALSEEAALTFPKDKDGNYTRAQLLVTPDTQYDAATQMVDLSQNPPVLIPIPSGG